MTSVGFESRATLLPRASADQIPEMLQAALAEFKLEIRREMKEQNVYARWWEIAAASPMTAPSGREPRKGPIEMLIVTHLEDDDGN